MATLTENAPIEYDWDNELLMADRLNGEESFRTYVGMAWPTLEPATAFIGNWHIDCLCDHLQAITEGHLRRVIFNVPPGSMKALDSDTPILTTWGWKRHGELLAGDFVFGLDGKPKRILACTPEVLEDSYVVTFDDGASIIAGAGHLWAVERDEIAHTPKFKRTREARLVTTKELRTSGFQRKKDEQRPDRIPVAMPLDTPPKRLLVEPYLLGVWLGDGATDSGALYASEEDIAHFSQLGRIGSTYPPSGTRTQNFYRIIVENLQTTLRVMGLLGNKHIPEEYLEASIPQRWELLQGLMDTDGHCSEEGVCHFTTVLPQMAVKFRRLAASLGMKVHERQRYTTLNGKRHGPHYLLTFMPEKGSIVFRLARKQMRVMGNRNPRSRYRYVTSVESIGDRVVKCIQVEGSIYLAGSRLVPTHNSLLVSVLWPTWHWIKLPADRFLTGSYTDVLSLRDALKSRRLIQSRWYQTLWGDRFRMTGDQNAKSRYENDKTGYRIATHVGGATGERAKLRILDDPHNIEEAESDTIREGVIDWVRHTWSERESDAKTSADVIVMQRLHERDVSGVLLSDVGGYAHVMLPMEYEPTRSFVTNVWNVQTAAVWTDPRTQEGELLCPARWDAEAVALKKKRLGAYACNPFEAPILMADLSMKPIGAVRVGDEIIGFNKKQRTDGKRGRLKLTKTIVTEAHEYVAPVVKMTLESGAVIRCTRDHKWYTRERGGGRAVYLPVMLGRSRLARVCPSSLPTLSEKDERLAGWLSGFFDGEGTVSHARRWYSGEYPPSASIHFYQGAGRNLPLCDKLEQALARFDFRFSVSIDERKDNKTAACYGYRDYRLRNSGLTLFQRFLHIVQPTKWRDRLIEGALRSQFVGGREKVISIEEDGEETVYALTTTTGNYVVWGLLSSNSAGQLQQRPSPEHGGILKRHWFKYWQYPGTNLPPVVVKYPDGAYHEHKPVDLPYSFDKVVQSWDMTFKDTVGSDFVVGQQYGLKGADSFLIDQIRDHLDFPETVAAVRTFNQKHKRYGGKKLIEDKANGPAIIATLAREIPGIVAYPGNDDKIARAHAHAYVVEGGNFYLPHPVIHARQADPEKGVTAQASWVEGFIEEAIVYPNGAYDDQIVGWSQAMTDLYEVEQPGVPITPEYSAKFHAAPQGIEPAPNRPSFRFWYQGLHPCCIIGQTWADGRIVLVDCLLGEQNSGIEELMDRKVIPTLAADYAGCTEWRDITNHGPLSKVSEPSEHRLDQLIHAKLQGHAEPGEPDFFVRLNAIHGLLSQTGRVLVNPAETPGEAKPWIHEALKGGYAFRQDQNGVVSKTESRRFHPLSSVGEALGHGLARIFVRKPIIPPKFNKDQAQKRAKQYAV